MNHKLQAYGYLCKPETRLHQQTKGVDGNTAHDADAQQPAGLDLFADQGVHQHHDAKVQKVRQNAVQHILQHQTGACEGDGGGQTHHACHHGTNDHQAYDATDVHQLVHHAAVELGQVLAAHGVAQLTGKPCDQHRGDDGDDHSQNGAQNAALLCQRDAQTKSDQADSALEEGVAHTGQGAHQRGFDGVDGLRVEVLTVGGVLLFHGGSQTQRKGTGLRGAVVERHLALVLHWL